MTKLQQLKHLSDTRKFYPYCFLLCKSGFAEDLHQDYLIALSECDNWPEMDKQVFTHFSQNLIYSIYKKKGDYRIEFEFFFDSAIETEIEPTEPIIKAECLNKALSELTWYERRVIEEYIKLPSQRKLAKHLHIWQGDIQRTIIRAKNKIRESEVCRECLQI